MTEDRSEQLDGGINQVVRIGDTVRRPVGPWSAAVHELLQRLESTGFSGAPRFLGIDEQGREILSYIAGERPWPPGPTLATHQVVESAARLLRDYHDA